MTENLVSGLAAQIERVSNKAERWKEYVKEMPPTAKAGMLFSIEVMHIELENAREALRSGDILAMMPAYRSLEGYSDDD
jgi:hypothetical protein